MPTAKRLPSGSFRVRVYSHTDHTGKKIYESFTAPTKGEAELKALEWKNGKKRHISSDITIAQAIDGYITAKEGVLSPSTIRGYRKMQRNNYRTIEKRPIKKISTEDLQLFVSDLSKTLNPKSVANIYGLLSSSLSFYMPENVFKVSLPKKIKKRPVSPSDEDIQTLFKAASPELKKCIALAAFGSLRRGEICALTYGDIEGNTIHITKDIVQDNDNKWILKNIPKNSDSIRDAFYPPEIIAMLGSGNKSDKPIKYKNPGSITQCFTKLRDRLGINVHFHQLRVYFCSIGAVLGIPTNYLEDFGGWRRGSNVMKEVYQNSISNKKEEYSNILQDHFRNLI